MAFLDDLAKATAIFSDGMQRLQTTNAFNRATEAVNQIEQEALKDQEKQAALMQTANQLAFDLAQSGTPVSRIQAAFQSIAPEAPRTAQQRIAAGIEFDDPEQVEAGQRQLFAEAAVPIAQSRVKELAAAEQRAVSRAEKLGKEGRASVRSELASFRKDNRTAFDAIDSSKRALALINKTFDQSAINLATISLLKLAGESGRLSDEDFRRAQFDPSFRRQVIRRLSNETLGRAPSDDRQFFKSMLTTLSNETANGLRERAATRADSLGGIVPGSSVKDLESRFLKIVPKDIEPENQRRRAPARGAAAPPPAGGINLQDFVK